MHTVQVCGRWWDNLPVRGCPTYWEGCISQCFRALKPNLSGRTRWKAAGWGNVAVGAQTRLAHFLATLVAAAVGVVVMLCPPEWNRAAVRLSVVRGAGIDLRLHPGCSTSA